MTDEDELKNLRGRVGELEGVLAQRDEGLDRAKARIVELEQSLAESTGNLNSLNERLGQAVTSYKTVIVRSNPGVVAELISGGSVAEIDASLEKAKGVVSRVKDGLAAEAARTRVPTGSPLRTPTDLSALSPAEKIRYAISQGGKK